MRSRIQTHKHVSYVFAGSKKHLLLSIFEEREGAFFKSAKADEPRPDSRRGHARGSWSTGSRRREAGWTPRCREGDRVGGRRRKPVLHPADRLRAVQHLDPPPVAGGLRERPYPRPWSTRRPAYSTSVGLDEEQAAETVPCSQPRATTAPPTARPSSRRHGLRSASHVQKAIAQLDSRGVTENGRIVDPLLVLWLERLAGGKGAARGLEMRSYFFRHMYPITGRPTPSCARPGPCSCRARSAC